MASPAMATMTKRGPEHPRGDEAPADAHTLIAQLRGDLVIGITLADVQALRQMEPHRLRGAEEEMGLPLLDCTVRARTVGGFTVGDFAGHRDCWVDFHR
ncbi:hypothetical protein DFO66_10212 [Brevibacterium sanguinis]|uniref:Uncharacterized protein n=2 Tax=Brevibacterium TaxID=1696 RepID=A0A366INC8_9MICO|nr:hypothetical protein DFO66_10212 [Brevibacterium sanguinis]RBP73484.1 hypothetical protein DFO65_10212 [Brevibacterium celere]